MNQIIHHLKNSNNLFLATHTNPDGDAIGSLIAMGLSLEALDKKTTLYNESPIPAVYRFLPFADRIVQYVDKANIYDTAIILDCSDLERIGKAVYMVNKKPIIFNILNFRCSILSLLSILIIISQIPALVIFSS